MVLYPDGSDQVGTVQLNETRNKLWYNLEIVHTDLERLTKNVLETWEWTKLCLTSGIIVSYAIILDDTD